MTAGARILPDGAARPRAGGRPRGAARPGGPCPISPDISPVEAFSRAADAFRALLTALPADAWRRPVLRDLDVQGWSGISPAWRTTCSGRWRAIADVACADHVGSTQAGRCAAGRRDRRRTTRREWRAAAERTLAAVARRGPRTRSSPLHGMRLPLGALLVVRAFELWTHENDIRRAAGLPRERAGRRDTAAR